MTVATNLRDLATAITVQHDPNSPAITAALTISAATATLLAHTSTDSTAQAWDFCSLAIHDALDQVRPHASPDDALVTGLPASRAAVVGDLAEDLRNLIRTLQTVYADAAARDDDPWRALAWATAAHHIHDACQAIP